MSNWFMHSKSLHYKVSRDKSTMRGQSQDHRNSTPCYPINREIRHQTLIFCIIAAGDAYCRPLVSPDPAVRQVFDQGVGENIDLRIDIAPSPCANAEIFDHYCDTVLIPVVASTREIEGCQNETTILLCNNCAAHCSDDFLRKPACHGILILAYPP
jgi:hypothetical protein